MTAAESAPPKRRPSIERPPLLFIEVLSALVLVGGIYLLISDRLTLGPSWLTLALVLGFAGVLTLLRWRGRRDPLSAAYTVRVAGLVLATLLAVAVAVSAALLVGWLFYGGLDARDLLSGGLGVWFANMIVFAYYYWLLDAGGPDFRHMHHYCSLALTDFLFPQQQVDRLAAGDWQPTFLDYLFVAFNASSAFSPTDTLILSRRVKLLMMLQSLISLVVAAVVVARAINTLDSPPPHGSTGALRDAAELLEFLWNAVTRRGAQG